MKYILEFGNRGGAHTENIKLPTAKLAYQLAVSLVNSFENDPCRVGNNAFDLLPMQGRATWQNQTHFVAISKLDGKLRGSASAGLWRKSDKPAPFMTQFEA